MTSFSQHVLNIYYWTEAYELTNSHSFGNKLLFLVGHMPGQAAIGGYANGCDLHELKPWIICLFDEDVCTRRHFRYPVGHSLLSN